MATYAEVLAIAEAKLRPITETPRLDAEILLAASLGIDRARLLTRFREECDAPNFESLLERRLNYEPIAYILGTWEFYGMDFRCRAPVLVPRPETEHLVEAVIAHVGGTSNPRVLDVCTGTGCVALAIARNSSTATVYAIDRSPDALALARENVEMHRIGDRVRLLYGDLMEGVREAPLFDAICANPPYVEECDWDGLPEVIRRHEDPGALLAGADGLDCVRRLVPQAAARLKPGGLIAFEIGEGQAEAAKAIVEEAEVLGAVSTVKDLAGIERIVTARLL